MPASSAPPSDSDPITRSVLEGFAKAWGVPPTILARAPGRVNVIGEHVDYNGGWVLPAAIERHMVFAVRPRTDGRVRLAAADYPEPYEFGLDDLAPDGGRHWGRYVKGVLAGLKAEGYTIPGFDGYLDSSIPMGGGLSSSAALEAVAGLAALELCGEKMDGFALAKICQKAEHDYAGVPCGIMDQAAVLNCRKGHLLLLDCEDESFTHTPFEVPGWVMMIINTGVAHELASGEYALRRRACEKAAKILNVSSLRNLTVDALTRALGTPLLDDEMQRCVRHVVTENARTHATVAALAKADVWQAGKHLNASHASLRDDYRVSCLELDFIAETAQQITAVAGCRMTGGGFGGSCIALVKEASVDAITKTIKTAYLEAFNRDAAIFITAAGDGATVQTLS